MNWETLSTNLARIDWRGPSEFDPRSELNEALAQPVGLPPLDQMMVADDQIAVAICEGNPSTGTLLEHLLGWLASHAVKPDHITVVLPIWELQPSTHSALNRVRDLHPEVRWVEHDPQDPYASAYLAADQNANPIYFNRALIDADVVIGLRSGRRTSPLDHSITMALELYPSFTNDDTWQRLYKAHSMGPRPSVPWRQELSEAENWLGTTVWIESYTNPNGEVARLTCGESQQLGATTRHMLGELWEPLSVETAELVVLDVSHQLDWDWPTWLWAIGQARMLFPDPPKLMLRGDLPQLDQRVAMSDVATSAREILSTWTLAECEQLGASDDIWVLGRTVPELTETAGWYWLESDSEAQKLIDRFSSALLVDGAFVASGGLALR